MKAYFVLDLSVRISRRFSPLSISLSLSPSLVQLYACLSAGTGTRVIALITADQTRPAIVESHIRGSDKGIA